MRGIKRVAVIGAGPAGAIAVDALAQEKTFDVIRVFERREAAGGCWIGDSAPPPRLTNLDQLAARNADPPIAIPPGLDSHPSRHPKTTQTRHTDSSIYPYLHTNVDVVTMAFSQESIDVDKSPESVALYGQETPFRHWTTLRTYVQGLIQRRGYESLVSYSTSVELARKVGDEWELTVRRDGVDADDWWVEKFDAVVVASGHYAVPYVPAIEGLVEFERLHPGSVLHSKNYRGRNDFKDKKVVVVGASVSSADLAFDLRDTAAEVHAVANGHRANTFFGDEAFNHPGISRHPSIARVEPSGTVHFIDGQSVESVDAILFGTGYSWSLSFLPHIQIRNNRVPGLYQHVVHEDPTLLFVGAVGAGLTFKIFEWQAVWAARLLAGRALPLPSLAERRAWETDRIAKRGDGPQFAVVHPEFEEYFETLRRLASPGKEGFGRPLPPFDGAWLTAFMQGHEKRKDMWRTINERARKEERAKL